MRLPDQMTAEELRELIRRYDERLQALPPLPDYTRLLTVRGGYLEQSALGAAVVRVSGSLPAPLGDPAQLVEVLYERPSYDTAQLRTSPARLVKLNGVWQRAGVEGMPVTEHLVQLADAAHVRITFAVVTERFYIDAPRDGSITVERNNVYAVPAAATVIAGQGRLVYTSGTEITLTGDPELLLRPDASGALSSQSGGIYARFIADAPALVRIGKVWIETPQIG